MFFFFKQKTAYEMRISDWSSDVCSSDFAERLELRDEQLVVDGLTPYWVNGEKYAAHLALREKEYGYPSSAEMRDRDDWYLSRESRNRLTKVIKCDSHLKTDGFIIKGERVNREGNRPTGCVQYLMRQMEKITLSVAYPRVLRRDGKVIEDSGGAHFTK